MTDTVSSKSKPPRRLTDIERSMLRAVQASWNGNSPRPITLPRVKFTTDDPADSEDGTP